MTVPHTEATGAWCHPTTRDPDKGSVQPDADQKTAEELARAFYASLSDEARRAMEILTEP